MAFFDSSSALPHCPKRAYETELDFAYQKIPHHHRFQHWVKDDLLRRVILSGQLLLFQKESNLTLENKPILRTNEQQNFRYI